MLALTIRGVFASVAIFQISDGAFDPTLKRYTPARSLSPKFDESDGGAAR
jgi:hypothetical protein